VRGAHDVFRLLVTLYGPVMIGTSISRYDILAELGQGGMSVVYLAQDTALSREVALKILHDHLAKKPDNRKRFRREAEAIARLRHPNILDVYDVSDESDDRSFIVMEYIPGMNLRQFIDTNGPPPPEVAALMGVEICNALAHAHKHGVIHRDLKPENVMVSEAGEIKLMDFGIAHVIDAETMTKTGSLLGSPAHMAPELIDGKRVDERVDVFALGTVLYWMSTGQLPFCGDNAPQVLRNVMECRYEEPEVVEPRIGHDLARIICKSLSKEPDKRFSAVETVKRELLAAVHSVGIEETEAVLRDYFSDPKAYGEQFADEIVPKLIARGKRAMERKNVPSAIALFNRVLAYDPQNEEVRECLAQLDRTQMTVRVLAAAAALVVVASAGWFIYDIASEESEPVASADVPRESVEGALAQARARARAVGEAREVVGQAQTSAQASLASEQARWIGLEVANLAERVATERGQKQLRLARLVEAPREPLIEARMVAPDQVDDATSQGTDPDEAVETFEVEFKIFPPSARLEIDGEKVYWQGPSIELTRGKHVLKATAPGCKPLREILVVNEPRSDKNKIPLVLDWRPATISIESNKNVLVYVGDEADPRSNARRSTISVPFQRKMREPKKTVRLRVADASNLRRVESREVVVEAGDSRTVKVNFP
jgi:serine/threonine-protein kinase